MSKAYDIELAKIRIEELREVLARLAEAGVADAAKLERIMATLGDTRDSLDELRCGGAR